MQKIRRRKFGEILLAEGVISQEQLNEVLERQKETRQPFGEILLQEGIVTESEIVRAICIQYQMPFIGMDAYQLTPSLINRFSVDFLFPNRIVPLDQFGSSFTVAVGEIPSEETEAELQAELGDEIYYYLAPASEVLQALKNHFTLTQEDVISLERSGSLDDDSIGAPGQQSLLDTLDSSWESIFDEAERNLTQEG